MTDSPDAGRACAVRFPDELADAFSEAGLADTLITRLGITLTEIGAETTRASMPVAGNVQPFGLLHGGASAALAETVGSVAALLHARRYGCVAVGIELSASHHRGVRSGKVHATARALSLGRTLATYDVAIVDDGGFKVCTARLTCVLRPAG